MKTVQRIEMLHELEAPEDAVFVVDERFATLHDWPFANSVVVAAGESLKTFEAVGQLAERVLELRSTRPMTVVAVGGGSLGDAAGFLASILWRGVDLWHVPTTLLAAADSAHGGKTAINLGTRKNQLGTFWPAKRVVLVEEVLARLAPPLRAEGMAEIIKALWLGAPEHQHVLEVVGTDALCFGAWTDVGDAVLSLLQRAIEVKQSIVARDPEEKLGIRTLLNLGHTLAHALELEESFAHGRAVAWGMAAAGHVSARRGLLAQDELDRLWNHVRPLLGARRPNLETEALAAALRADKKRLDSKLRSVLLRGPGDAFVVDDVSVGEWFEALEAVRERADSPLSIRLGAQPGAPIALSASKSIFNRALAIAALRPGVTTVTGNSEADDVRHMQSALASIRRGESADVGDGGTTYRFLVAVAAASQGAKLQRSAALSRRPHDPLHDALRRAGATIEEDAGLVSVSALPAGDHDFEVEAGESSQFASALALIAASGRRVSVCLTGAVASRPYFEMTLALLVQAGVRVTWDGPDRVDLAPTPRLHEPLTLAVEPDASSSAVWAVARFLGLDVEFESPPSGLQPDADVERYLWEFADTDVTRDLAASPDLAPVLAAAAALTEPRVRLVGARHLRLKESNRIEDLVASFAAVGIDIAALEDGLEIPSGAHWPRPGALWPTHGDHRLAMAGCLLAIATPITIEHPLVVSKSYPEFWADAMTAGFRVITDRSGRSPDT